MTGTPFVVKEVHVTESTIQKLAVAILSEGEKLKLSPEELVATFDVVRDFLLDKLGMQIIETVCREGTETIN